MDSTSLPAPWSQLWSDRDQKFYLAKTSTGFTTFEDPRGAAPAYTPFPTVAETTVAVTPPPPPPASSCDKKSDASTLSSSWSVPRHPLPPIPTSSFKERSSQSYLHPTPIAGSTSSNSPSPCQSPSNYFRPSSLPSPHSSSCPKLSCMHPIPTAGPSSSDQLLQIAGNPSHGTAPAQLCRDMSISGIGVLLHVKADAKIAKLEAKHARNMEKVEAKVMWKAVKAIRKQEKRETKEIRRQEKNEWKDVRREEKRERKEIRRKEKKERKDFEREEKRDSKEMRREEKKERREMRTAGQVKLLVAVGPQLNPGCGKGVLRVLLTLRTAQRLLKASNENWKKGRSHVAHSKTAASTPPARQKPEQAAAHSTLAIIQLIDPPSSQHPTLGCYGIKNSVAHDNETGTSAGQKTPLA
ncbi:hypothetical protein BDK51DRAFT_26150 [Blyttiomyces helicus]|uniref:WW domain-containing protein n=1 Tax=Blyttiomyces helicus TaxID=388810 RepID=A0A4P9W0Y6_9FUNG|nr:hypothetical protein BDK51DRAFT_26150 [Blyttiomyces helicus]|eukprot:RKO83716.1 hypothetical protein BDK51DRAFT_26150 [Blyttiomyces helicus]